MVVTVAVGVPEEERVGLAVVDSVAVGVGVPVWLGLGVCDAPSVADGELDGVLELVSEMDGVLDDVALDDGVTVGVADAGMGAAATPLQEQGWEGGLAVGREGRASDG